MRLLLEIYFGFNLFMTGYVWGDDMKFSSSKHERNKVLFNCFKWGTLGGILLALDIIWIIIGSPCKWINKTFQIAFFFQFWLTNHYRKLPDEQLRAINYASSRKDRKKLSGRIFIYCTKLVNKRNGNYIYKEVPPEF